jgi:hypothetical protein
MKKKIEGVTYPTDSAGHADRVHDRLEITDMQTST